MAHKGFIRTQGNAKPDNESVRRLMQRGIPLKNIHSGNKFHPNAAWLHKEDCLVVCSLSDLHGKPEPLLQILSTFVTRNIHIISLDEPWFDTDSDTLRQTISGFTKLFVSMRRGRNAVQKPTPKIGRPRGLTAVSLSKCKVCEEIYNTTRQPLLEILKSQNLYYSTWRRYKLEYLPQPTIKS